jgi:flagellar motor switch protein FliM
MSAQGAAIENPRGRLANVFAGASAERVAALHGAFERVAGSFNETFAAAYGTAVELVFKEITTGLASDSLGDLAFVGLVGVVRASPWDTCLLVRLPRSTVSTIVDLTLGGDGFEPPEAAKRPISVIDTKLSRPLVERLASSLQAVFCNPGVEFAIEDMLEHIDLKAFARASDTIATAAFELRASNWAADVRISLPQPMLAQMRQALTELVPKDSVKPDPRWSERIETEVARANVTLSAILDERASLLGEISSFRVGQIVELKATVNSPVRVECNGERLLWCNLGKSNGVYTLRVRDFVDRQKEFIDDILAAV